MVRWFFVLLGVLGAPRILHDFGKTFSRAPSTPPQSYFFLCRRDDRDGGRVTVMEEKKLRLSDQLAASWVRERLGEDGL